MTDLVKSLRICAGADSLKGCAKCDFCDTVDDECDCIKRIMEESADTIERLRTALKTAATELAKAGYCCDSPARCDTMYPRRCEECIYTELLTEAVRDAARDKE